VTNIKFSIPRSSFVKITVFDITGREVTRLVNENMNAGSYTVDFNASDLATGVYLYRIDADGFTACKENDADKVAKLFLPACRSVSVGRKSRKAGLIK
jgi:hypothetical protein